MSCKGNRLQLQFPYVLAFSNNIGINFILTCVSESPNSKTFGNKLAAMNSPPSLVLHVLWTMLGVKDIVMSTMSYIITRRPQANVMRKVDLTRMRECQTELIP